MESVIKWQTGVPSDNGGYIVTMKDSSITLDYREDDKWFIHEEGVIAWCPLNEIESYKE